MRRSESLVEGTWLFSWPAAVGIAIPTITRTTAALGRGPGSGQTVQPHILLADGRNVCVSGVETSREEPRAGATHQLCVFSPLPVPFSSLLGFCLFFWTLDIGPQNGEALRLYQHQQMPSKQEGFETAMDPFGLSGF